MRPALLFWWRFARVEIRAIRRGGYAVRYFGAALRASARYWRWVYVQGGA